MASYGVVLIIICVYFINLNNASSHFNEHQSSRVGIIGGHTIDIKKVPFMASLRLNGTYHWCGASIIHEQFLLTAAHCIVPNRTFKILVGTDLVDQGGELYDVERIITHQRFSNKTNDYDICLIKLNRTLNFGPKVAKIELADKSVKLKKGVMLDVNGWGYTNANPPISNSLLQVTMPVVSTKVCQLIYMKALQMITSRMICVGGDGKDSCQGDSGGPLTQNNVQVGITSFGAGCGNAPGVYTKIVPMLPWIKNTINENL